MAKPLSSMVMNGGERSAQPAWMESAKAEYAGKLTVEKPGFSDNAVSPIPRQISEGVESVTSRNNVHAIQYGQGLPL
jgi:hypothetical protein